MKEKRDDVYSSIVMLLFAVFLFAASYLIQPTTSDILGSRFFPRLISVIIGFLAVFQLIGALSVLKEYKNKKEAEETVEKKEKSFALLITVVSLFVYYILILQIGFTITSILYLFIQGAVLMSKEDLKKKSKLVVLVLVSVLVPIFINTVFWNIFSIALPAGKLF